MNKNSSLDLTQLFMYKLPSWSSCGWLQLIIFFTNKSNFSLFVLSSSYSVCLTIRGRHQHLCLGNFGLTPPSSFKEVPYFWLALFTLWEFYLSSPGSLDQSRRLRQYQFGLQFLLFFFLFHPGMGIVLLKFSLLKYFLLFHAAGNQCVGTLRLRHPLCCLEGW